MNEDPRRLELPADLADDDAAFELVSAWFASNRVKIMTRSGTGLDDDPAPWGEILTGIAENIAVCIQDMNGADPSETMAIIKEALDKRWTVGPLPEGTNHKRP